MVHQFCSCGKFALRWDQGGTLEKNAAYPENDKPSSLCQMSCLVELTKDPGTCKFCRLFAERDLNFEGLWLQHDNATKLLKDKQDVLANFHAQVKKTRIQFEEARKATYFAIRNYKRTFEVNPWGPEPSECSGHYKATNPIDSARSDNALGSNERASETSDSTPLKVDQNNRCPKCQFQEVVLYNQSFLSDINYRNFTIVEEMKRFEGSDEVRVCIEEVSRTDALLEAEWKKSFQWLHDLLFPSERPVKKMKTRN